MSEAGKWRDGRRAKLLAERAAKPIASIVSAVGSGTSAPGAAANCLDRNARSMMT
jgi:hypothetical protein